MLKSAVLSVLALAGIAQAHMRLWEPAPFNASNNPYRTTKPDSELLFPFNCCGDVTPFPCRGYLSLLGTPDGAPTAKWAAGSQQYWSMDGTERYGGNHYGGSCQVGFSIDQGKTFRVASSYEGNCPHRNSGTSYKNQRFNFTVPDDLPTGDVVFAWTWFNREQEFFMNCAAVTISGKTVSSGSGSAASSASSSSSSSSTLSVMSSTASSTGSRSVSRAVAASSPISSSTPVSSTTPVSSSTSVSSAKSAASSTSSGTHEVRGCSCSCTSYTTNKDGSVSLNNCTCACPNTVASKHKRHPLHKAMLHAADSVAADDNIVTLPNIGVLDLARRDEAALEKRIAFNSRPKMFIANIGNGCESPKTDWELQFPQPGPDVYMGDGEYPLALPTGTCS